MRSHKDQSSRPHDVKKPGKPKGLPGLLLYGALTILGGLALVVVAEYPAQSTGAGALSRSPWPCLR